MGNDNRKEPEMPHLDRLPDNRANVILNVGQLLDISATDVLTRVIDAIDKLDDPAQDALDVVIRASFHGDDDYDELVHEMDHALGNECTYAADDDICPLADPIADLRDGMWSMLTAQTPEHAEAACGLIRDGVETLGRFYDGLNISMATAIMNAARAIDPTESTHAAHIRDAIRDNTDRDI